MHAFAFARAFISIQFDFFREGRLVSEPHYHVQLEISNFLFMYVWWLAVSGGGVPVGHTLSAIHSSKLWPINL